MVNLNLLNSDTFIQKFASIAENDIKNPLSINLLSSQALRVRYKKNQDWVYLHLVDMSIITTKILLNLMDEILEYLKFPPPYYQRKPNLI